jgi:23S rRNA (cytosine1962-C5)-methyltransferase
MSGEDNNIPENYILLDSGNLQKLEQVGKYRLIRPALNAYWHPSLPEEEWNMAIGVFRRNSSGAGVWKWKQHPPPSWKVNYGEYSLITKPTDFGHLGFFPEQIDNWKWLYRTAAETPRVQTLNLFAYSGGSSLALAEGGADVCHVDAAKGMLDWARENLSINHQIPANIRWIVDDVNKFINREIKRNRTYPGIVLDPPSFGRGPRGQIWKIEQDLVPLLKNLKKIMGSKPLFMLLSMHSQGFSPNCLERILYSLFKNKGTISHGEMVISEQSGRKLPAGIFARWHC